VKDIQGHLRDRNNRKAILRQAGDIYACSSSQREALERFKQFKRDWVQKEPEAVRLFSEGFEHTLRYFDSPRHMWASLRTTNPLEQQIAKLRAWLARFTYFRGRANLDLALFSYIFYKDGALVSDASSEADYEKPTLFVA